MMARQKPPAERKSIGFWLESHRGAQWNKQGMTRLIGFLVEGAAISRDVIFHIVLTNEIYKEASEDLATLNAELGVDYCVHAPKSVGSDEDDFVSLAKFANKHVQVDAWISLFPFYENLHLLGAPVATIFPDAIPLVYQDFNPACWTENGYHVQWRANVDKQLRSIRNIITFSNHVAQNHVRALFDVSAQGFHVIPHAPPTLEGILPFVKGKERTALSRRRAADLLRRHCAERGWDYLVDFPFEEVPYVAVSTQDRVTKNLRIVADAIERIGRRDRRGFKMLMTAPLLAGTRWTPLPETIENSQSNRDIVSMPDLPRDVHAAFYHCAELAIHPSIFEGGLGVFPFYEAVSVGTPCIMASGPHASEFVDQCPDYAPYTFDANDAEALVRLIKKVSDTREAVMVRQGEIFDRLRRRTWGEVASQYAWAATQPIKARDRSTVASVDVK